jgi:hypothetical protein
VAVDLEEPIATPDPRSKELEALEKLAGRALNALNAARTQAGALPLGRHAGLEAAAWVHAQYDVANGQKGGNFEASGAPLFIGETPSARVARANVGRAAHVERVGELMAQGETEPEQVVQGWLDSVYHRALLLDIQIQFAGFGQHGDAQAATAVLDLAGRREGATGTGGFPGSGATDVPTRCACDDYAEGTGKNASFGYPVTLLLGSSRPAGAPKVAVLTEGGEDGPEVAVDLVDAFGNPTLVPHAALKPNTRYTANFQWAGGPSVRWSFTTRS